MDTFGIYKPFRNYLRNYPLVDSMWVLRAYFQRLQFSQQLPPEIGQLKSPLGSAFSIERYLHEWELEQLCKEIILNSDWSGNCSLRNWDSLAATINKLKELNQAIYARSPNHEDNILLHLFRIAHQQFPWQRKPNTSWLFRHFKIFSHPDLDAILQRRLGLDAAKIFTIGLALVGKYLSNFAVERTSLPIALPKITRDHFETFAGHFSADFRHLREMIGSSQRHDDSYEFAFNPMRQYPLINLEFNSKKLLLAPIPTLLFRKLTSGIYYDVVSAEGFSDAYGTSFQAYVGDIANLVGPTWHRLPEQGYRVGANDKQSVDWILGDATADLFVECKTKRLRVGSKIDLENLDNLRGDLEKLAEAVVQVYKTLLDAMSGHYPHWQWRDKPVYPVVVTVEEWFLFSPAVYEMLENSVLKLFEKSNLDKALLEAHPYTICEVEDFEYAIQVMSGTMIDRLWSKKTQKLHRQWNLHAFMLAEFRNELNRVRTVESKDAFPAILAGLK